MPDEDRVPTRPVRPAAPYLGGKRNLAARIIARQEAIPHRLYVEPFVGMGGVFLRRPWRSSAEVINDLSADVATLFRVLQRHYVPLMDMLRWQLTSRAEFERLLAANAETLTDLERAARFLYLQRTAYGGKVTGRNFGVVRDGPARFDVTRLAPLLEEVHSRLSGVVIERLPYAELIRRYNRPGTLFYLDPPYWGVEGDYGAALFSAEEWTRLAEQLRHVKGRWMLSLNDVPAVRELFGWASIEGVETTYGVSGGSGGSVRAREVIIEGGGMS